MKTNYLPVTALCGLFLLSVALIWSAPTGNLLRGYPAVTRSELALGTVIRLTLPDTGRTANAMEAAFHLIRSLEERFSVYRPESELSRLNGQAGGVVSDSMATLLKQALSFARLSQGAFDPTCGALIRLYRQAKERGYPPTEKEIKAALTKVGWEKVKLSNHKLNMPAGMSLDLGGIAKGYIVDCVRDLLARHRFPGALIDAGGDIFCAGSNPEGQPWQVGVQNPWQSDKVLTILHLSDRAVATSGDYRRYLTIKGKKYSHIVDPRTGRTVQEFPVSVTVVAADCTSADALATACFVLGREKGLQLLTRVKDVEGMIVDADGQVASTPGWPALLGQKITVVNP